MIAGVNRELIRRIWGRWYFIVFTVLLGTVFALINIFAPHGTSAPNGTSSAPPIPWWIVSFAPLLGLVLAEFLVLREIVQERDAARAELRDRDQSLEGSLVLASVGAVIAAGPPDPSGRIPCLVEYNIALTNTSTDVLTWGMEQVTMSVGTDATSFTNPDKRFDEVILPRQQGNYVHPRIRATMIDVDARGNFDVKKLQAGQADFAAIYSFQSGGPKYRVRQSFKITWLVTGPMTATPRFEAATAATHERLPEE